MATTNEHAVAREGGLEFRFVANDRDLLFESAALGEHRQIKRAAHAIGEVDNNERVVQDVGHTTVVDLVEMVHVLTARGEHTRWLGTCDQSHEIEEVATLLDQGATGVLAEAIPVSHLHQEGKSMFANRHHARGAAHASSELLEQGGHNRDVAVFETNPRHCFAAGGALAHIETVGNRCAHRLFDHHGEVGGKHIGKQRCMCEVGRRDDHRVEIVTLEQRPMIVIRVDRAACTGGSKIERRLNRVAERDDLGVVDLGDVENVLAAHHSRADNAVAHRCGAARRSGRHR